MNQALVKYEQDANNLVAFAANVTIQSREDFEVVTDALRQVVDTRGSIKAERDAVVKPMAAALDAARDLFKRIDAKYEAVEGRFRSEIARFTDEQQQLEAELLEAAADAEVHSLALVTSAAPVAEGVSTRKLKKWRLADASQVPDQYWQLDEVKIGKAIRAGVQIPGIEAYHETSVAVSRS